jgi:hypothetical protein
MYKSFFYPLTKNKTLEVEIDSTNTYSWFDFSFVLTKKSDHAGLYITISLFKWELRIQISDNRHWNWDENRWYYEGEEYNKWLVELKDLDKQFKNLDLQKYEVGDDNIHDFYLKQFQKVKSDLDLYKEIIKDIKKSKNESTTKRN